MSSLQWILTGCLIALGSGVPALCCGSRRQAGQLLSTLLLLCGNLMGLMGVWQWWAGGPASPLVLPSPWENVTVSLALDGISAFFLMPIFLVTSLASCFGLQYWSPKEHPESVTRVSLFLGGVTAGMVLLVVAHDGLMFLLGWEIMAVSAMILVASEDHLPETRQAAWLYLAASHLATLCLFGVFGLLYAINGSFDFQPLADPGSRAALQLAILAFLGFGIKAGLMPLHVWLPSAHAQAPSHVSALMSGVILKMGVYGFVRIASLYTSVPLSWGLLVMAVGTISVVLGVAFAVSQQDFKRLLAYSSIENIGIIFIGLGLALVGRSMNEPLWILLGFCGAMLHVWNHAIFKSLLFFSAGSILHAVGTRNMDLLGGLSRRLPITANCFLLGSIAICGLPPLNGFVSEMLIYLGLFRTLATPTASIASASALAAPALALVGALAVACFVKVGGVIFLGAPRSKTAEQAHEGGLAMKIPLLLLAAGCVLIGMVPVALAPCLDRTAQAWAGDQLAGFTLAEQAPLGILSGVGAGLLVLILAGYGFLLARGIRQAPTGLTWDCGYAAPTARMQYTSSSFAEMLVNLFGWALQPKTQRPTIKDSFPADAQFMSRIDDTVLEKGVLPGTHFVVWLFSFARRLQQGSLQAYLLYILLIIVALLLYR